MVEPLLTFKSHTASELDIGVNYTQLCFRKQGPFDDADSQDVAITALPEKLQYFILFSKSYEVIVLYRLYAIMVAQAG
jgi:hypothetical protein